MEMFEVPHLYPCFLWEIPHGSQMWYQWEVVEQLIHSTGWTPWGDGGRLRENCDVSLACYDLGICSEMSQQIQGMAPDKNRCLLRSSWLINSAESLLAWTWCRIFSWLRRLWSMFFVVDGLPTVSAFLGVLGVGDWRPEEAVEVLQQLRSRLGASSVPLILVLKFSTEVRCN